MNVDVVQELDPRMLGRRLQEARKARGRTQQEAAEHIEVARTTLVAMEKGERRVQPRELIALAGYYGRDVSEMLRAGEPADAFVVQLRAPATLSVDKELLGSARVEFQRLCEDYLELEGLQGMPLTRRYPQPYDIGKIAPEAAAEDVAVAERHRLGLGDGPVPGLRDVLESDVGLRIFDIVLPRPISEMFGYTEQLGGCIAVASYEPEERRRMSIAHAFGHFLTNRYEAEICAAGFHRTSAQERFAGAFASAFLMPGSGVRRHFHDLSGMRGGKATPADILLLAHRYVVSPQAMTLRLEDLRLVRAGTWEVLRTHGFKVREAQRLLGLDEMRVQSQGLPARYLFLAIDAYNRDVISQGQLASFLRTDPVDARRLVEELSSSESEADANEHSRLQFASDQLLPD